MYEFFHFFKRTDDDLENWKKIGWKFSLLFGENNTLTQNYQFCEQIGRIKFQNFSSRMMRKEEERR